MSERTPDEQRLPTTVDISEPDKAPPANDAELGYVRRCFRPAGHYLGEMINRVLARLTQAEDARWKLQKCYDDAAKKCSELVGEVDKVIGQKLAAEKERDEARESAAEYSGIVEAIQAQVDELQGIVDRKDFRAELQRQAEAERRTSCHDNQLSQGATCTASPEMQAAGVGRQQEGLPDQTMSRPAACPNCSTYQTVLREIQAEIDRGKAKDCLGCCNGNDIPDETLCRACWRIWVGDKSYLLWDWRETEARITKALASTAKESEAK